MIDFVGGQEDLAQRRLRAIGDARHRFAEDKLRMLRAVRFAATFGFSLDRRDASGHCRHGRRNPRRQPRADRHGNAADAGRSQPCGRRATDVGDRGWPPPSCRKSCPATKPSGAGSTTRWRGFRGWRLTPHFPLALAALLYPFVDAEGAAAVCGRWRLSNKETERVGWLVGQHASLLDARAMRWSALQPLLVAEGIDDLLALTEAGSSAGAAAAADTAARC